jgi:DtxR family Mn-dependent transcriptional regulator
MTVASERYLETIYELGEQANGEVRVKDLAGALNISHPSVSQMVDRLVEVGLVTHDKYQHIALTQKGRRIAKGLDRKHEVIKTFFQDILGVQAEVADRDACEIERVISNETLNKLVKYLEKNA